MQIHKTVFISYRRTNTPLALLIYEKLTAQGFDVFLDHKKMGSGDFTQIIPKQIANRAHFVLILTPSALERCVDPNDWVRREIETAMKLKRNIVPLIVEGFNFDNEKHHLKGDYLPLLEKYNRLPIYFRYINPGIDALQNEFLNKPLDTVLHPLSKQEQDEVEQVKEEIEEEKVSPEQLKAQEYFEKGMIKVKNSNFSEAVDDFTRAILFDDNFGANYNNRGNAYQNLKNYRSALEDYNKAIEIDPENPIFYENRGNVYNDLDNLQLALRDYNKAIEIDCNSSAYNNRGNVYKELNEYDKALLDYDRAIELNPDNPIFYYNRASTHESLSEYELAIESYNKAIELNPNNSIFHNGRGNIHFTLKKYKKAIADYSKAIELDPQDLIPLYNRGNVFANLKEYQNAILDYELALLIQPNHELIINTLEYVQLLMDMQE